MPDLAAGAPVFCACIALATLAAAFCHGAALLFIAGSPGCAGWTGACSCGRGGGAAASGAAAGA